jgi:hypothetical protein
VPAVDNRQKRSPWLLSMITIFVIKVRALEKILALNFVFTVVVYFWLLCLAPSDAGKAK